LIERITAANNFAERVNQVGHMDPGIAVDDYLRFYEQPPEMSSAALSNLRFEAERYVPILRKIRNDYTMDDAEEWCAQIDRLHGRIPW
jgi:hypothetical protein